jgi:DeoR family transcriptional regulator of aga operon
VPDINLIMIGEALRHVSRSCAGPQAQKMIADFRVDHLFLGVDGLEPEKGLLTPDVPEAELNTGIVADSKIARIILRLLEGEASK